MASLIQWLEQHDKLAGWAQLAGTTLALIVTYFTAFAPIWHRKRQLRKAASRLLLNGYEVLESYYRTTPKFLPTTLTLRGAALSFGVVIDDIARFPVYELDDQGSRSLARNLIAINGSLIGVRLILENTAEIIDGRDATEDERDIIIEFLGDRLEFVRKLLAGEELIRPEWPNSSTGG